MESEQSPVASDDLELLEYLLEAEGIEPPDREPIPRRDTHGDAPLSFAQQRLYALWRLDPHGSAYTIAVALGLSGRLDVAALRTALYAVVARHEALRTCFQVRDGQPRQRVLRDWWPALPVRDLGRLSPERRQGRLERYLNAAGRRTFDPMVGPPLEARLLRLGETDHVAVLTLHHILADGASMEVLVRELGELYAAALAHRSPNLPELPIQYSDYALWQRDREGQLAEQLDYWLRRLDGLPPLELPTDHPPSPRGRRGAACLGFQLPPELSAALGRLAAGRQTTLFTVLLAGFFVLLHRYTGQTDLAVGVPVAGRDRQELEPLIGLFVNTLVLRTRPDPAAGFGALLDQLSAAAPMDFQHGALPFERLVAALDPDRAAGDNPLFRVMFTVQQGGAEVLKLPGLSLAPLDPPPGAAKFDLLLALTETPEAVVGSFEYDAGLFEPTTLERMAGHYRTLLEAAVAASDRPLGELPLLTGAERAQLDRWNATATPWPRRGLAALFAEQAATRPDAPAVDYGDCGLSYGQLNARANRLAHALLARGLVPEEPVGLCLEPGLDLVAGLLAILKAGGVYLPLNPAYPPERLAHMVADAGARRVLTRPELLERLPSDLETLYPDAPEIQTLSPVDPPLQGGPERLAYLVYTSGSTGEPKGIAVTQGAVARLVLATDYTQLGPDDVVAQLSNPAFDALTFEVWGALLTGARLLGVERDVSLAPKRLAALIRERGITALFLTTALFNQVVRVIPDAFAPLRWLLFGGEAVDPSRVREVLEHGPPGALLHVYGPSETTTFATWQPVRAVPVEAVTVPIGGPLANTELYVLDRHGQPLPVGAPGELYIGGDGLARGYLKRPALTAETFVPHPWRVGARLYRSGDRVRRLADGTLEFQGRLDQQVKIRGFRIEPGEVAAVLARHLALRDVVVTVREDRPGERRLVAYVCPRPGTDPTAGELRGFLKERLPDYMVPTAYVSLETLPVNANGKVDRKALPPPSVVAPDSGRPPEGARELALAGVWEAVLGRPGIGADGHWFELGGDSISAIQVVSRLQALGWRLEMGDVFRHPGLAEQAARLTPLERAGVADAPATGSAPLLPVQDWFLATHRGPLHHFNQAALLMAAEALDPAALDTALGALLNRHEALALGFRRGRAGLEQVYREDRNPALQVLDLRDQADPGAAQAHHGETVQGSLDLAGPLFKAVLYRRADGDRLLLVAHHLVVDGVSWRLLLEDLERAYLQARAGQAPVLGPKPPTFAAWGRALGNLAEAPELLAERDYWRAAETGPDPWPVALPGRYGDCRTQRLSLTHAQTAALEAAGPAYHAGLRELLLAALGAALARWRGGGRFRLLLESHGREPFPGSPDPGGSVGWFTALFPFVLETAHEPGERIETVKESLARAPRKGLGYGVLTRLTPEAERGGLGRCPWPSVSFNYLGRFGDGAGGLLRPAHEPSGTTIAPELTRHSLLDLVAALSGGRLELAALYDPEQLPAAELERFLDHWRDELALLAAHCRDRQPRKSPADFAVPDLDLGAFRALLADRGWAAEAVDDAYPLSPMQAGLLFETLYAPESRAYHVQAGYRLRGALDPERFRAAWALLCRRHPVLRSAVVHRDRSRPLQLVFRERPPELAVEDLRSLDPAARDRRIGELRRGDLERGFDLEREPLLRLRLLRLEDRRWLLLWSYHHLILDGWCLGVLHQEFGVVYQALAEGREPNLPPAAPYGDYIRWLESRDQATARDWWGDYLQGYERLASLPRRPEQQPFQPGELAFRFPDSAGLRDLAARRGVTLNTLIQCLWALLLGRYNDSNEVVFGAVVSGRPAELAGVESSVGLFINTVPVRVTLDPAQGFAALLGVVQNQALAAEPHHHCPLAEIQSASPLGRGLFDHLLIFENLPSGGDGEGEGNGNGLVLESMGEIHDRTHYALDLMIVPGESLRGRFHYDAGVHDPALVERLAEQLQTLARRVLAAPETPVGGLSILTESDQVRLKALGSGPSGVVPWPTVVAGFRAAVARTPQASALIQGDRTWSYAELDRRSEGLARGLRRLGLGSGERVGLLLDRSPWLVVAVLGVLKAGAAYLPLDPAHPRGRLAWQLQDSGCARVLAESAYLDRLPPGLGLSPPELAEAGEGEDGPPLADPAPESLAYLIYTSGSTGRPKGVMIEHRNLVHYLGWAAARYFPEGTYGRFGLYSPLGFDLTVTSLFLPLLRGRSLTVFPPDVQPDQVLRESFAPDSALDSVKLTPAHIALLGELDLPPGQVALAIVGGEALTPEQVACLHRLNPAMAVHNEYGPTETTVGCVVDQVPPGARRVTIGRPMSGVRIVLADRRGQPVPLGAVGEILIGGQGVARGYLGRPGLTAERFVPEPGGGRLYRSGDLGRWREDGRLEYLGRADHQLKVRGQRVEPGEVEQALRDCPGVREALVVAHRGGLAAYLAGTGVDLTALRRQLGERLPEALLPGWLVVLERLPLTANGKVDRRALPDPEAERAESGDATPRDALETRLAALWRGLLGLERLGIHDTFFELGGNSLSALQAVARIHGEFGVRLSLKDFFAAPTVIGLAARLRGARPRGAGGRALEPIPPAPEADHYPLSHAQQRLWLEHHLTGAGVYNLPEALVLDQELDGVALEQALQGLIRRHEVLRTAFVERDGEPRQRVLPAVDFRLGYVDLGAEPDPEAAAQALADQEAAAPFDLTRPPLLRARLARLGEGRCLLLLNLHHIVADGWSKDLLYRELLALYRAAQERAAQERAAQERAAQERAAQERAAQEGRPAPLPPLPIQYKDYAVWQQGRAVTGEDWWLERLRDCPGPLPLPFDRPPGRVRDHRGDRRRLALDAAVTAGLRVLAARRGVTLSSVVLTLYLLLLRQLAGRDDLLVGLAAANRGHPDLERLIGCFVNLLPLRLDLSGDPEFEDLLGRVAETVLEGLEHQDTPYDHLLRRLTGGRRAGERGLVNIVYAFQDAGPALDWGERPAGVGPARSLDFAFDAAKFDLCLVALDRGETLELVLEYAADGFEAASIDRYLQALGRFAGLVAGEFVRQG